MLRQSQLLLTMKLCGLLLCSLMSPQLAAKVEGEMPLRGEVIDFGVYELLQQGQAQFKADSTAGYHRLIDSRLITQGDQIPLRQGLVFGLNFRIQHAGFSGEWLPLTIEFKHPLTYDFLGVESGGFSQHSAARLRPDGYYYNGAFYIFSEQNEMLPGQWEIRILYRQQLLLVQTFSVQ